ncbi:MAG: hypothetical protein AUH42_07210 [Gemmatimonadetes bacterium 13_1_40CM_70_11]|nr:MAG: hypothetical protein AUH42_07210 [Gemmatimonadetes bacterium 13_1_40CM_70_11]
MDDDRLGERLEQAARDYHRPPATPREELWARIQAERARRRAAPRVLVLQPWLRWGLAAAAVLLLGVAIGRSTAPTTPALSVARADLPYRVAAAQYLTRTEALLTGFRTDSRPGAADSQFVAQARDLLLTTRLMLDSPVAKSAPMRALLEDLEVVLAQIATLPSRQDAEDVKLINESIEQRSVLLRLRTSVPAGTQGAL